MKSVTTILLVENDAVALTMYQKRLQREGFHVEVAEDGIAALRVLSEMTPDVVVLDLMLPKFSGKDVFDYMRADPQFKAVPVIIFSNAGKADWPKEIESSPTRSLPKSEANFAALLELIREMSAAGSAAAFAAADGVAPESDASNLVWPDASDTLTTTEPAPEPEELGAQTAEQFLEYAVADMAVLREYCLTFIKAPNTEAGRANLSKLHQRLKVLNDGAQKTGCARLALLATGWGALLAEIERKPAVMSASILQTLAQAADCLRILLNNNAVNPMDPLPGARVLSVDDDEICNDVAVSALQRANMDADSVLDANAALELLQENDYDLVLLDINMPGLTGFELCEKLRALPRHEKTPVIFVTAYNNFENRKQSVLSGGGDLIAKPVSPLELALKVTIHLLKAPPKVPMAPVESLGSEGGLVWKEPVQTISHDTEMFLRDFSKLNAAPGLVSPTTETRTSDPETDVSEPTPQAEPESVEVPEEVLQPAGLIGSEALAELRMKSAEAKVLERVAPSYPLPTTEVAAPTLPSPDIETSLPISDDNDANDHGTNGDEGDNGIALADAPLSRAVPSEPDRPIETPTPASKKNKILESANESHRLANEGTVVPTQPSKTTETPLPDSNGSSKKKEIMNKENNPKFDTLVLDVAHIIFGDNAPDINVRLVRMALETVWQNRAELQSIDAIAREIARIIFGDNTPDLNVRLVRMALERSNSIALFKAA
jgi:DNA-binding response OmpR family regulator